MRHVLSMEEKRRTASLGSNMVVTTPHILHSSWMKGFFFRIHSLSWCANMFCVLFKRRGFLGSLGQNYPKWLMSPNDSTPPAVFRGKPTVFQSEGLGGGQNDITLWHATTLRRRDAPPPRLQVNFAPPNRFRRRVAALPDVADLINAMCRSPPLNQLPRH